MKFISVFLSTITFLFSMDKVFIEIDKNITIPKIDDHFLSKYSFSKKSVKLNSFYISKYEITKKEYSDYLKLKKRKKIKLFSKDDGDEPVTNVNFFEAQEFCKFYNGRLPTELEWIVSASVKLAKSHCYEYIKKYSFSPYPTQKYPLKQNDKQIICMMKEDDEIEPSLIGSELLEVQYSYENINGIYGMLGNVWEWVNAKKIYFNKTYQTIKGGSYANFKDKKLFDVRVSNFLEPNAKRENVGFRCVWNEKEIKKKRNKK